MRTLEQPPWLKKRIPLNSNIDVTKGIVKEFKINTVCQSAKCPNIFDCFSNLCATFLILGNICSRGCRFCCVKEGVPEGVDEGEPFKIAQAASRLGLRYVVITSVTRDDLADYGANQFSLTIKAVRKGLGAGANIEVLVPDFKGDKTSVKRVVEASPDVFSHNMETVPRLYESLRPAADYRRSINVLRLAKEIDPYLVTKSALMAGLGETQEEIVSVMKDLRETGCDIFYIGQYLRPSSKQVEVTEFISPDKFLMYEKIGDSFGFKEVKAGPFVRSSYKVRE